MALLPLAQIEMDSNSDAIALIIMIIIRIIIIIVAVIIVMIMLQKHVSKTYNYTNVMVRQSKQNKFRTPKQLNRSTAFGAE